MAIHLKSTGVDFTDLGHLSGMAEELLDDYEFGNYTPAFLSMTASSASGGYCHIGRFVQVKIFMVSPGSGSSGDNLGSTLPYTVGNSNYNHGVCACMIDELNTNVEGVGFQPSINTGNGIAVVNLARTGSHAAILENTTGTSTDFRASVHYFT
jgi:hypothetical protein